MAQLADFYKGNSKRFWAIIRFACATQPGREAEILLSMGNAVLTINHTFTEDTMTSLTRLLTAILLLIALAAPAMATETAVAGRGIGSSAPAVGSNLRAMSQIPLTDASPTYTVTIYTAGAGSIGGDLVADKGCTLVVTPLPVDGDTGTTGKDSDTVTIADGGASERWIYSNLLAPWVKITVTKTEAGDMADFTFTARTAK